MVNCRNVCTVCPLCPFRPFGPFVPHSPTGRNSDKGRHRLEVGNLDSLGDLLIVRVEQIQFFRFGGLKFRGVGVVYGCSAYSIDSTDPYMLWLEAPPTIDL